MGLKVMHERYRLGLTVGREPEFYGGLHGRRDRIAIKCGEASLTWAELGVRVHRLARAWEESGVERGATVATFLQNRIEIIELMYSLARVSLTNATINSKYTARELADAVRACDVRAIVVDSALVHVVDEALRDSSTIGPKDIYVVGGDGNHPYSTYDELLAGGDDEPIGREPDENDIVWLASTGGTTGTPKTCLSPQRAWVQTWIAVCRELTIGRNDVELICGSMNHAMGLLCGMSCLYAGGTLIMLTEFDPVEALRIIERERVTFLAGAAPLFNMLLQVPDYRRFDVSSVRKVYSAGAPMMTSTKLKIFDFFQDAEFMSAYGATETGFTTMLYPEDQLRKTQCAGQPLLGMEIAVFDDDGRRCETGEVGTIYKRGWHMAVEYYKDPEATAAQFLDDWHTAGDMGYLDDEGYLYISDRKKNMIISGGINVYPTEIEDVLSSHPAVREVAVIGTPDDRWGETVCAVVVLHAGSEEDPTSLQAFCRERLAKFKVPRRFEFRTELPKTYAGKVSHRELRDPFWAGWDGRL